MKVKTLLATMIAPQIIKKTLFTDMNDDDSTCEMVAALSNRIAEKIMKQNGECMDEQIALFIPGEPG